MQNAPPGAVRAQLPQIHCGCTQISGDRSGYFGTSVTSCANVSHCCMSHGCPWTCPGSHQGYTAARGCGPSRCSTAPGSCWGHTVGRQFPKLLIIPSFWDTSDDALAITWPTQMHALHLQTAACMSGCPPQPRCGERLPRDPMRGSEQLGARGHQDEWCHLLSAITPPPVGPGGGKEGDRYGVGAAGGARHQESCGAQMCLTKE